MTPTPRLSPADVRMEVERLFRKPHRSHLVALYGRGEPDSFELEDATWRIVPTTCELLLREHLAEAEHADDPRMVFLLDWTEDVLPLDIACRLAGGRVYHVARNARLAALFGAREVEEGLAGSALARMLLSGEVSGLGRITGLRLTRDEAWRRFLHTRLDLPTSALGGVASLLAWALTSEEGPGFLRAMESDELTEQVHRELVDWLEERLGDGGLLAWRAWERGEVRRLLQILVVLDAAEHTDDGYLRGMVEGQVAAWLPSLADHLRAAWRALLRDGVLDEVLVPEAEATLPLLEEAEQLVADPALQPLVAASRWLVGGHAARERALARRLEAFAQEPGTETYQAVLSAACRLAEHKLDPRTRGREHIETRQMLLRLVAWLLDRHARPGVGSYGRPWQAAVDLARRQSEEGGFLDWARGRVRAWRGADPALAQAARAILAQVDAQARDDDRRFAESYIAWVEAGRPAGDVVPIEDVVGHVVRPFLEGGKHRRLLLILMDGMSQCSAVQLLHRLQTERRWGPIAWRARGWRGALPIPPVLAVAPTLTELSRGALFAGRADPRFMQEGTGLDDRRWASNPALRGLLDDGEAQLFFRRDIHAGHAMRPEVRQAIGGEQRVVAVVVNAIDEHLDGSIQVGLDYSQTPILPLEALLSAAEGAERAVLLVADHGHVPGDAMTTTPRPAGDDRPAGARWRAIRDGEPLEEGEIRLPRNCWKPRGWDGVAVLWDSRACHRFPSHGEHGGLSLAEAVAPAFLVGPEWLDRVGVEDVELSCRPLPVPAWWDLREPPAPPMAAAPPREQPQLSLLASPLSAASSVDDGEREPDLIGQLRASRAFRDHVRGQPGPEIERILRWLGVLARAGGSLATHEFARAAGVRAHQVGGVVARMGLLNADGYAMVEHDLAGRRVVLHLSRLTQQFGLRRETRS